MIFFDLSVPFSSPSSPSKLSAPPLTVSAAPLIVSIKDVLRRHSYFRRECCGGVRWGSAQQQQQKTPGPAPANPRARLPSYPASCSTAKRPLLIHLFKQKKETQKKAPPIGSARDFPCRPCVTRATKSPGHDTAERDGSGNTSPHRASCLALDSGTGKCKHDVADALLDL